jgi:hypothetical protein
MRQIKTFSDYRLENMCSYCGDFPDTKDHVPSRVLLDEPFPENLLVVPCCNKCNQSFSLDEEYVACILECVICGTTIVENLKREKISKKLEKNKALLQKITNSIVQSDGQLSFNIEVDRLQNVILKLSKGHIKYENSEPVFEEPTYFGFRPLHTMTKKEVDLFLSTTELTKSPEVGSRAMQNFLINNNMVQSHWTIVQSDNYCYSVNTNLNSISVKIIMLNYLATEMIWQYN